MVHHSEVTSQICLSISFGRKRRFFKRDNASILITSSSALAGQLLLELSTLIPKLSTLFLDIVLGSLYFVPRPYPSANKPNPQGLGLLLQPQTGLLEADEFSLVAMEDGGFTKINDVAAWRILNLHERLLAKHHETFWIDAETKKEGSQEYFRVTEILHTKNQYPLNLTFFLIKVRLR